MDTIYWHANATQGDANLHPGVNLHPGANCAYEHGLRCLHFYTWSNMFFSRTKSPMILKLGMQHRRLKFYFYGKVKFGLLLSMHVNGENYCKVILMEKKLVVIRFTDDLLLKNLTPAD